MAGASKQEEIQQKIIETTSLLRGLKRDLAYEELQAKYEEEEGQQAKLAAIDNPNAMHDFPTRAEIKSANYRVLQKWVMKYRTGKKGDENWCKANGKAEVLRAFLLEFEDDDEDDEKE